ncbi:hypothetical protein [Thermomonas flagellata]|uniref:hypothetical protein n=1 Tax=Thermomonas flagellata TaxID=2888524 RepID=UPI001F03B683|nr:hypothetical protein [Thermomonas flagellata]
MFVLVAACADAGGQNAAETAFSPVEREVLERELAVSLAPIRSGAELNRYLAAHPMAATPLAALSAPARERFLRSLVFGKDGLATFDYRDIQRELTATQAYRLLALFGVQRSTPSIPGLRVETRVDELILLHKAEGLRAAADYLNYKCESRATCAPAHGLICIGANC